MDVPRRAGRRVILNFHGIGDPPASVPAAEVPYWCPLDQWLPLVEVVAEAVHEGRPVEVTFDDGNVSDVQHALPALLKYGLTATFHACAGRIGRRDYLDEPMMRHLHEAGMQVGSHGWDHVDLRPLTDADLVRETRDSQHRIEDACGWPVRDFAVPLGSYDRRVLRHLRDYATVYTSDATTGARGARLVPRWSYVQGWSTRLVHDLACGDESVGHRLRQHLSMTVKRWR
ncbi:hypothetical protein BJF81_14125 [Ornithinimicrobium sp. CNJ-824]|nr:hypothetical protein BJF81_14125 [Ornithinimicrobium sp. CNJ-824]